MLIDGAPQLSMAMAMAMAIANISCINLQGVVGESMAAYLHGLETVAFHAQETMSSPPPKIFILFRSGVLRSHVFSSDLLRIRIRIRSRGEAARELHRLPEAEVADPGLDVNREEGPRRRNPREAELRGDGERSHGRRAPRSQAHLHREAEGGIGSVAGMVGELHGGAGSFCGRADVQGKVLGIAQHDPRGELDPWSRQWELHPHKGAPMLLISELERSFHGGWGGFRVSELGFQRRKQPLEVRVSGKKTTIGD